MNPLLEGENVVQLGVDPETIWKKKEAVDRMNPSVRKMLLSGGGGLGRRNVHRKSSALSKKQESRDRVHVSNEEKSARQHLEKRGRRVRSGGRA